MISLFLNPALLAAAANQTGAGGMLGLFMPLVLVMGIMYFLMIRPQKKKEQALRDQLKQMQVGDEVITIGGIVGRVFNIQGDEVTIATSIYNTHLTFKKSAINSIIKKNGETVRKTAASAESKENEAEAENKGGISSVFGKVFKKKDDVE